MMFDIALGRPVRDFRSIAPESIDRVSRNMHAQLCSRWSIEGTPKIPRTKAAALGTGPRLAQAFTRPDPVNGVVEGIATHRASRRREPGTLNRPGAAYFQTLKRARSIRHFPK